MRAFAAGLLPPPYGASIEPRRIDPNRASLGELQALPGIGPTRAESIVLARVRHGPFRDLDGLLQVDGLGPDLVAGIARHVQFGQQSMPPTQR